MQVDPVQSTPAESPRSTHILRALRHRNYRLFFGGQSISLIGTWMQQIALGWLVYRLTNSAFLLGLVSFTGQVPMFFLAPFAGVLADRWNLHRVILVTQTCAMVQALLLAGLVLTHAVTIWQIIPLSLMLGIVNAFDTPSRQSFIIQMVEDKRDLSNAIALNSSMVNAARLIGPSIAGLLIAAVGEGVCFLINGISYVAVIVALLAMRLRKSEKPKSNARVFTGLMEGVKYAYATVPIRSILVLLTCISLIGLPFPSLMPIFARDVLHGGPHTLGFLMGAVGVGALTGALYLASRHTVLGLGRVLASASGFLGVGLILVSASRIEWLSIGLMYLVGLGMMTQVATSNTLLQTIVDDDKRGRVISLFAVAFMGTLPFGSLLAGTIASAIGAPRTLMIDGALCIVASLIFWSKLPAWRKHVRPIYVKKGILTG